MSELRPYPVYLFVNGAFALCFMLYATIASVYRIQTVGLNPLQLVLVGTVLELAVLIFEVPTGILADTYSRRLSVIIGFFLIGAGFMLEGPVPVFLAVLVAQVIWGAGCTLSVNTPTRSSLKAFRSVSSRSLPEKAARVLAEAFIQGLRSAP